MMTSREHRNKYFCSPTLSDNIITMTGINLNNGTLVSEGGFDQNIVFTPSNDTSGIITFSKFVNISSLTGAPYSYKWFFEDITEIERYWSSLLAQWEWAWWFLGTDQNHRYSYLLHKESNSWTWQNTYPRVQIEIRIEGLRFRGMVYPTYYFKIHLYYQLNHNQSSKIRQQSCSSKELDSEKLILKVKSSSKQFDVILNRTYIH